MSHTYLVFGLTLESDLACPELLPAATASTPDVNISSGHAPESLAHPLDSGVYWQVAPGQYLLKQPQVGRFLVRDGSQIIYQPAPGVSDEILRAFLLGTCLSIVLHQRRLFALHCSGIHTERGAVLFSGNSGSGKSTLVSAFLQRGHKMLSDDLLALTFDGQGQVMVLPGFPQVKLWADSAGALGRPTDGLQRVVSDYERFFVPVKESFNATPVPLKAVYFLRIHDSPEFVLEPLSHTLRFNALLDHTWQKLTLGGLGLREWHFQAAARIASLTYAARFTRPREPLEVRQAAEFIAADLDVAHGVA